MAGSFVPLLSVSSRRADFAPVVVGANCTPISQPPPGGTGVAHVLLGPSLKCAAPVPARVRTSMVAGTGPSLLTTTLSSSDTLLTTTLPKARLGVVGSTLITGLLEPLSAIVRAAVPVLSAIESVATEAAFARGVNVTSIVQRRPEPSRESAAAAAQPNVAT